MELNEYDSLIKELTSIPDEIKEKEVRILQLNRQKHAITKKIEAIERNYIVIVNNQKDTFSNQALRDAEVQRRMSIDSDVRESKESELIIFEEIMQVQPELERLRNRLNVISMIIELLKIKHRMN